MKLLIVGRTGSGKDTLQHFLTKYYGFKTVNSYTTRARRPGEGDTHVFITREEAAAIPIEDKVAITYIKNGDNEPDEYFATKQQVEDCDCYIIDPKGIRTLTANMPDEVFEICYLHAESKEKQKEMAILRANGDVKAGEIFEARYDSENEQFTTFEKTFPDWRKYNKGALFEFTNDYSEDSLRQLAFRLSNRKHLYDTLQSIITDLKAMKVLTTDEDGKILVRMQTVETKEEYEKPYTDSQFAQLLLYSPNGFLDLLHEWLSCPRTQIKPFSVPKTEREITLEEKVTDIVTGLTKDNPEIDIKAMTTDICGELETLDEFHETIDNYITNMVLSRLDK